MITTKLQNGGVVYAEAKRGDAHWVAAEWNGKHVTWSLGKGDATGQDAYHGHYFDDKQAALDDLAHRAFGLRRTD